MERATNAAGLEVIEGRWYQWWGKCCEVKRLFATVEEPHAAIAIPRERGEERRNVPISQLARLEWEGRAVTRVKGEERAPGPGRESSRRQGAPSA